MALVLDPLDIVCFHVGGYGGYGPLDAVVQRFPQSCVTVLFEARDEATDQATASVYEEKGVRTLLVPACVGDRVERRPFFVNRGVASSSMFPPAERVATNRMFVESDVRLWGENAAPDRVVALATTTLDLLAEAGTVPPPDVLSIDAQGAEHRILRGARRLVDGHVGCVITEVEFEEIYAGQGLFTDQMAFLAERDFRLADLLSQQYWHPAPMIGEGFLTVAEALFLRSHEAFHPHLPAEARIPKLVKLAAVAACFARLSHAYEVMRFLIAGYGETARATADRRFPFLTALHDYVEASRERHAADPRVFLSDYRPVFELLEEHGLAFRERYFTKECDVGFKPHRAAYPVG